MQTDVFYGVLPYHSKSLKTRHFFVLYWFILIWLYHEIKKYEDKYISLATMKYRTLDNILKFSFLLNLMYHEVTDKTFTNTKRRKFQKFLLKSQEIISFC